MTKTRLTFTFHTFAVILQLYTTSCICAEFHQPLKKIEFNVSYVALDPNEDIGSNQTCLQGYARRFLEMFIQLGASGMDICKSYNFTVTFSHKAWVHFESNRGNTASAAVFSPNVLIDPRTRNFNLSALEECSQKVRLWLNDITILEELLRNLSEQSTFYYINNTANCMPIIMKPQQILHHMTKWICPDNFTFNFSDPSDPFCHQEFYLSVTTSLSVTSNKQMSTESVNKSDLDKYNKTQNQTGLPFIVMKSWSIRPIRNISQVHITEADRVRNFILQITLNKTAICLDHQCPMVSVDVHFTSSGQEIPLCKRDGRKVASLVLGRIIMNGQEIQENTCSVKLSNFSNASLIRDEDFSFQLNLKAMMNHKIADDQIHKMVIDIKSKETNIYKIIDSIVVPIVIEDKDRKATCQSINDPHLTSFDGLQFNNFYEGEFVLYQHTRLPFKVHGLFQKCNIDIPASCNCGVAIQTGNDVLVIDRCVRKTMTGLPDVVRQSSSSSSTSYEPPLQVQLYLNGNLTQGTSIFQEAEGKRYLVFLPHGTYVKVMVNSPMINLWIVPSPKDLFMTEGLCGFYDCFKHNDLMLRNHTKLEPENPEYRNLSDRIHPHQFLLDWRVDLYSNESLFSGAKATHKDYHPTTYCECWNDTECIETLDVNFCDLKQGKDITQTLIEHAMRVQPVEKRLMKRSTRPFHHPHQNIEPISIRDDFIPPKYKWQKQWNNEVADSFCRQYIKMNYTLGQLCSQIKAVDFEQEITSCIEDIKITANTFWANSAREAMKEQCLEEIQRNSLIPKNIVDQINDKLCINDCSNHGTCRNGICNCNQNYISSDCSVTESLPPVVTELKDFGLCNIRDTICNRAILYGKNFIDGPNLTCHLQECKISEDPYQPLNNRMIRKASFINFNSVVCPLPYIKSYLVRISNNGLNTSRPFLFIPFDSACTACEQTNSTCRKKKNSCIIDGQCYAQGQSSPTDECLVCKAVDDEFQWSTISDGSCNRYDMSDWVVAGIAAIGGSVIGSIAGYLLYKCCCKRTKSMELSDQSLGSQCHYPSDEFLNTVPNLNSNLLHRSHTTSQTLNTTPDLLGQHTDINENLTPSNDMDTSTYF